MHAGAYVHRPAHTSKPWSVICTEARLATLVHRYPKLHAAPKSMYYQLVVLIIRLMGADEGFGVAKTVDSMLDSFENGMSDEKMKFLTRMISDVSERCANDHVAFVDFPLSDLDKVATAGLKTVTGLGDDARMEKAKTAMEELLKSYIQDFPPVQWASLFTDAASKAYHLKYMFREDVEEATKQFKLAVKHTPADSGGAQGGMFDALVDRALKTYGKKGLVDQDALQRTNFMRNPRELMDLIDPAKFDPAKDKRDPLLKQVADIAVKVQQISSWNFHHPSYHLLLLVPHDMQGHLPSSTPSSYPSHTPLAPRPKAYLGTSFSFHASDADCAPCQLPLRSIWR